MIIFVVLQLYLVINVNFCLCCLLISTLEIELLNYWIFGMFANNIPLFFLLNRMRSCSSFFFLKKVTQKSQQNCKKRFKLCNKMTEYNNTYHLRKQNQQLQTPIFPQDRSTTFCHDSLFFLNNFFNCS